MTETPKLLVFRNVRAVDPAAELDQDCDVVIENGQIVRIGVGAGQEPAAAPGARVLDGEGRWLLPALVESHAHLREPGQEYKEDIASGLAAAAAGGYAHVCCMANTNPVNDTVAVTEFMLRRAAAAGTAKLHPIAAITKGLHGEQLSEMAELRAAGVRAVSDDGVCVRSSAVMRRALEYARNFDLLVIQHPEDHALTVGADMHEGWVSTRLGLRGAPRAAEDSIIARDVMLAAEAGARYHAAHVSTAGGVALVRQAKDRGLPVTCEVTPHHLLLLDEAVEGYRTVCKVNPPLREEQDRRALREALADGTIDSIVTDHAPHSPLEKDCEFSEAAPGLMGLELCFALVLGLLRDSELTLARLIDAISTRPAKIMGIAPPALREGVRAELVLVDPHAEWRPVDVELRSKSRNTPFLADTLTGRVLLTMAEGTVIYDGLGSL